MEEGMRILQNEKQASHRGNDKCRRKDTDSFQVRVEPMNLEENHRIDNAKYYLADNERHAVELNHMQGPLKLRPVSSDRPYLKHVSFRIFEERCKKKELRLACK